MPLGIFMFLLVWPLHWSTAVSIVRFCLCFQGDRMSHMSERSQSFLTPLGWLLALFAGWAAWWQGSRNSQPDDWASLWVGGRIVADGHADSLYSIDPTDFGNPTGPVWAEYGEKVSDLAPFAHPFVHNPLVAYVLAPVTQLMSFSTSASVLLVLSGISVVLFSAGCINLWTRQTPQIVPLIIVSVAVWVSASTQLSFWIGQTTPIIMMLIVVGLCMSARRPWLSGLLLSIAVLIKLTPVLIVVIMLIFAKRRRAGVWAAGLSLLWVLLTLIVAPGPVIGAWLQTLGWLGSKTLVSPINQSLASLLARGQQPEGSIVAVIDEAPASVMWWSFGIVLVTIALFLFSLIRLKDFRFEICAVVAFVGVTALAGIVWTHYTMAAFVAVAGLVVLSEKTSWWAVLGLLPAVLLFPPFGEAFVSAERTPNSLMWAGFLSLVIPMIALAGMGLGARPEIRSERTLRWGSLVTSVKEIASGRG
ncbi:DUF2029 domain-containing protein [Corynebacterium pseudotuberculosis]|uniref:DUF2029 domain-containing protein n=2 Tax=Corynebacterium pseudotuberculosis TaxID=1719 RepID=A0AAU8Q4Q5_CORPS|nr:DUF2029 domain-containing protein [Corynebacterium pseudotuberculosis CIP 52.97]AFB73292.2 DUF2029 domain-containing protein [Corynebacterium pseudotuberculosis 316]AFH91743.2 DUF2029 domain-containing protein [Corynebacterium pseudotuberculosis 31]AFK17590.2 DUF2029 domain-containing protein [Corynebacterium pseudotuberculosis 258]AMN70777.1 DUF2029 domain-containing protein [Corynebacterium pseudotuberculosis]